MSYDDCRFHHPSKHHINLHSNKIRRGRAQSIDRIYAGNMDTPTNLLSLPSEVTRLTASFLSASDALHLAETCKTLQSKLSLRLLPDSHVLFTSNARSGDRRWGHKDIPFVQIPCLSPNVHSITLTFQWHDQGWGNSAGGLWVIRRNKNTPPDPFQRFYGGQVVWQSELAPKARAPLRVTFSTSPDEIYQLWFRVGMGGGHELHLHDGRFSALVFDDRQVNVPETARNRRQRLGVIADEQPQAEFGPVNVQGLHYSIGSVGVHVFEY